MRRFSTKLWGGRFTGKTDPVMEQFNSSLSYDKRLWKHDVAGSQAYASALAKCGILTVQEAKTIREGMDRVAREWAEV
jgi:argininosuccinate lyase